MPEIEQARLNALENTVRSVAAIMKDPTRKMKLLELQKEAQPDAVIPELETHKAVNETVASLTKKMDELKTELQSEREKRDNDFKLAEFQKKMSEGRGYLASRGCLPELVEKIEKYMEERGIANHEDGLAAYERAFPPQEPVRSNGLADFLSHMKSDGGDDEFAKAMIASRGEDGFALDREIARIRREGQ